MKVFIIGHGEMMHCPLNKSHNMFKRLVNPNINQVYFYIKEGGMLHDGYIPGIIQIETGIISNLGLRDFFDNTSVSDRKEHDKRNNCNVEHGLFTIGDDIYSCILYKAYEMTDNYKDIWNLHKNNSSNKFQLKNKIIINNNILNVKKLSGDITNVVYNHFKDKNDAILLAPQSDIPESDPILLSSIIQTCVQRFGECQFHWLACRSYFLY